MSYNEDEETTEDGFKVGGTDDDELEIPEGMTDFGLDEEDPDKDR